MIRVQRSHGALGRTTMFESAGTQLLPTKSRTTRGSIANSPTMNSWTSAWANDSDRCSNNYPRFRATASRTRRRRIDFSTTIESAKRRFWTVTFRRRAIVRQQPAGRSWSPYHRVGVCRRFLEPIGNSSCHATASSTKHPGVRRCHKLIGNSLHAIRRALSHRAQLCSLAAGSNRAMVSAASHESRP